MTRQAVRQKRSRLLAASVVALMLLGGPELASTPPHLVWNASSSVPRGLYQVSLPSGLERGALVAGRLPPRAEKLASERRYVPAGLPVIKRVAAVGGDIVCSGKDWVTINGKPGALRRKVDRAGRPMPHWSGCRRLQADELLLLASHPDSFDGRYFGITRKSDVLGRARLLWLA